MCTPRGVAPASFLSSLKRIGLALAAAACLAGCQAEETDAVAVVISLPDQYVAGVSSATVAVDYSSTGARLLHEGGGPACAFILPGFDGDFSDDGRGTLTIRTRGVRSLRGPADIAACRMDAGEGATAAGVQRRIQVQISAAEDAEGKPIEVSAAGSASRRTQRPGKDERVDIEEAQEAAVRAAVGQAAARAASAPAAAAGGKQASPGSTPSSSSAAAAPARPVAPSPGAAAAAAAAAAARKTAAKGGGANSQGVVRTPGGAAAGDQGSPAAQDDPVPLAEDRDPGYDDSPADDESAPAYTLEFTVLGSGVYGALQLEINHLGQSGGFIGRGDQVDCVPLVDALVASNYLGERIVKIGLISLQGVPSGPIMRCGFRTRESLSPASFLVQVTDASDTESVQIDPPPTVAISTISRR